MNTGIFWFTNDLRVDDNPALANATKHLGHLLCVYVVEPSWFEPNRYGQKSLGDHRWHFLLESLDDLQGALGKVGQQLLLVNDTPLSGLGKLITAFGVNSLFRSQNAGYYENHYWQQLQQRYPQLLFKEFPSHTLFSEDSLPFSLNDFPGSFSKFRKQVESLTPIATEGNISQLTFPSPPKGLAWAQPKLPKTSNSQHTPLFTGGSRAGKKHLLQYFSKRHASSYKETRNALGDWESSTKFSPWLANGSLSINHILRNLQHYEATIERNDSTEWIYFEILWREYFQWLAHANSYRLFSPKGIKQIKPLTSFYPERFQRWCQGNTPFPLVNACMKQLKSTGYLSNRGRQIVASCFVNELNLDWRYGAAYFEQELIDYDVAVNWGNWQYLAGVGTDPRGKRHFDIDKQTALYDPDHRFINKWQGETNILPMDSVDASDWPITRL